MEKEPWWGSLIVKVLGRRVGYMYLKKCLMLLWKPKGDLKVISLGNDCYLVKFEHREDRSHFPWMILGHYLTLREWVLNFDHEEAQIAKAAVWVCIPVFPLRYYNGNWLQEIGNHLGIHLVCFGCGRYGHKQDCPTTDLAAAKKKTIEGVLWEELGTAVATKPANSDSALATRLGMTSATMTIKQALRDLLVDRRPMRQSGQVIADGRPRRSPAQKETEGCRGNLLEPLFTEWVLWRDWVNPVIAAPPVDGYGSRAPNLDPDNTARDRQINGWSLGILTRFSIPVKRVEGTFNPMPALWFRDTLEDCSLMDLGSSGPHFTWRGQEFTGYEQVVFKRLDRAVCNASWRSAFPEEAVRVLPCFKSGHHALLLDISGFRPDQRVQRPFRYLAAWHTHSNFPRMLQSSWQSSLSFAMNPDYELEEILNGFAGRVVTGLQGLNSPFSLEEVRRAPFEMPPFKAPWPDSFQTIFYQHNWNIVGQSVYDFIRGVFKGSVPVALFNDALIVLIPKVELPETVHNFRPISLCNVPYKLITKLVANRLQGYMAKLVFPNQVNLVVGRHIQDNIVIAQEMVHTMSRMRGDKRFMSIKIDLKKIYIHIEKKICVQIGWDARSALRLPVRTYLYQSSPIGLGPLMFGDIIGKIKVRRALPFVGRPGSTGLVEIVAPKQMYSYDFVEDMKGCMIL
ncbi:hypothetical protein CRG98_039056 [Punica granatum]|uniref:CCHC-type domain-containing protein n=1 Tax=Punica granatum TaxID=22663 RepID=A0A2I0I978_PUNGR|nr:hypothetical protein CRG98_039056 [Punica granatum]